MTEGAPLEFDVDHFDGLSMQSPVMTNNNEKDGSFSSSTPDTFDGEKELDGMSRYISNTFSPSIFRSNTPSPQVPPPQPLSPMLSTQPIMMVPISPSQLQQQQQQQQYLFAQQQMNQQQVQQQQPQYQAAPQQSTNGNNNASGLVEMHQARAAELSRHQQQLQDLHDFYRSELAEKDQTMDDLRTEGSGTSLSNIAHLEESLRLQENEKNNIINDLRRSNLDQKNEFDDISKRLLEISKIKAQLSEKLRESETGKLTTEKDLQNDKEIAVRQLENQMRNSEDKLREEIKREQNLRKKAVAECMQATALGTSLSSEIDKLKINYERSEKERMRLQAILDGEKQEKIDLKRQLKLDQVTLQQTLNETDI